ncbi:Hypothetical predicted protein, partial [Pelobates cultripes]
RKFTRTPHKVARTCGQPQLETRYSRRTQRYHRITPPTETDDQNNTTRNGNAAGNAKPPPTPFFPTPNNHSSKHE